MRFIFLLAAASLAVPAFARTAADADATTISPLQTVEPGVALAGSTLKGLRNAAVAGQPSVGQSADWPQGQAPR